MKLIVPRQVCSRPIRHRIRVDLPTPLRPITPTISPRETDMVTPCRIGVAPYPAQSSDTSKIRSVEGDLVSMGLTKIDFRHVLVLQNAFEIAARKNLAEVQNGDPLGDLPHERH